MRSSKSDGPSPTNSPRHHQPLFSMLTTISSSGEANPTHLFGWEGAVNVTFNLAYQGLISCRFPCPPFSQVSVGTDRLDCLRLLILTTYCWYEHRVINANSGQQSSGMARQSRSTRRPFTQRFKHRPKLHTQESTTPADKVRTFVLGKSKLPAVIARAMCPEC